MRPWLPLYVSEKKVSPEIDDEFDPTCSVVSETLGHKARLLLLPPLKLLPVAGRNMYALLIAIVVVGVHSSACCEGNSVMCRYWSV